MKKALKIVSSVIAVLIIIIVAASYIFEEELRDLTTEIRCKKGIPGQCFNLGIFHQDRKDYKKAKKYYKFACDGGYADGCYNYGYLFMDGIGGVEDHEVMVKYYKKGCVFGQWRACNFLSTIYLKGIPGVDKDSKKAIFWAEKTCEFNKEVCVVSSFYLMDGQLEKAEKHAGNNPRSLNRGKIKLLKGNKKEAYKIYNEFLKDNSYENVRLVKKGLKELIDVYPDKSSQIREFEESLEKILIYDLEIDFNRYKRRCFENKAFHSCYGLTWYGILVKKLDVAEKAFKKEQKNHPSSEIEFNIGHWYLIKDKRDEALSNFIVGLKKMKAKKEDKMRIIKEDFKLLSEVYPEKTKAFKEMEETLISYVEKSGGAKND